jgi:succinate dehydrogenase / fumarate reductase, cytochrome b subunit
MTWKEMFTSSIGKKLVMGFTGLFLITFLIVHVGINACIFANDGGGMFNRAAHFMGSTVVIRIMEVGLMAGFLLHIVQGLMLEVQNRSKRPSRYHVNKPAQNSKWYSRSMGLMGTLVLLFLVLHLGHFWVKARFTGGIPETADGHHDMFELMKITFSEWWIVLVYILGCISLAWHLVHGFQSAFRTVGVHNKKYLKMANQAGIVFSVIVCAAFAMMPIAMYFKWIQ